MKKTSIQPAIYLIDTLDSGLLDAFHEQAAEVPAVTFDLETTGIQAGVDRIVEIGAVRFVDGEPQTPFNELVNPQCVIPDEAIAVHKITNRKKTVSAGIEPNLLEGHIEGGETSVDVTDDPVAA